MKQIKFLVTAIIVVFCLGGLFSLIPPRSTAVAFYKKNITEKDKEMVRRGFPVQVQCQDGKRYTVWIKGDEVYQEDRDGNITVRKVDEVEFMK